MMNKMKTFPKILSIAFLALLATSCSIFHDITRPIFQGLPDENDATENCFRVVHNDTLQAPFHFIRTNDTIPAIKKMLIEDKSLDASGIPLGDFMKLHKTLSFAIIRNDTVLYEFYDKGIEPTTNVTSFSIAKSYVAMLVGIAIQEGKIKSVDESISDFLPELNDIPDINRITIKNLLQHTSGIKFSKTMYNPWSDNAEFYYTDNLRKRALDIDIQEPPGLHFDYQSENTMLLALILEKATGMSVSQYLEEKIWSQIGTEAPATWNTDRSDSLAIEKAFCCLNARTMDFAKFGRLLLHQGNWNGKQIIPASFIKDATTPSANDGGKMTYGYNMAIGPEKYGSFFPIGLYGQIIYVYPKQNIIIVRFGASSFSYHSNYWKEVMLQIIDQL